MIRNRTVNGQIRELVDMAITGNITIRELIAALNRSSVDMTFHYNLITTPMRIVENNTGETVVEEIGIFPWAYAEANNMLRARGRADLVPGISRDYHPEFD